MIIAGAALGALVGFGLGLLAAVFSSDGIWPQVWAGMILSGAALGALAGVLDAVL